MKKFFIIILTIFIAILQLSFLPNLPGLNYLNLILGLVVILLFFESNFLFPFILIAGLILDSYSFPHLPLITVSLGLTAFVLNRLFKNLFTNRSLYSLSLLGLLSVLINNFILSLLIYLSYFLKFLEQSPSLNKNYFIHLFWQTILTFIFLIFTWSIINFYHQRFKHTLFLRI